VGFFRKHADRYGFDHLMGAAQAYQESRLEQGLRSRAGAVGVMQVNEGLFAFAAYNAGPGRVAGLRRKAEAGGLDPNRWFGHVERVAARGIGRETVQYVGNVYKYDVADRMVAEQDKEKAEARRLGASPRRAGCRG
jgi:membrane-bound lytic murein transglycosylase MltF